MHTRTYPVIFTALVFAARLVQAVQQPHPFGDGPNDKSQSPYFQVTGASASAEAFPLKATSIKASITGVIADVSVEQIYTNKGKVPIEAIYVFPASTRAAVHGVEMKIGSRIVTAKIQEKGQAQATYDKAKSENKTASLLEQHRPNVFQMSLANILPGDEVHVTLHYSEKLAATDRVYEFIYPTVVGPRYSSKATTPEKWTQNPYLGEGISSPTTFAINVDVKAGMPLQSLTSPSHEAEIKFNGKDMASVALPANAQNGNRDFILRYQLADQQVASGLLLHKGADENFFLLNVQPPARVKPDQVTPRDYLFILDVSGSMDGFPIQTGKVLMGDLMNGLHNGDTFNVLHFAGVSALLSETSLPATRENIERGINMTNGTRAGGGTNLLPALDRALKLPQAAGVSRSIVVITDGYVDIEKQAFELVRKHLNKANVFAFGIGTAVNRHLIEGLAHAGQGEPFIVSDASQAREAAAKFRDYVSAPVLTNIEVRYEGFANTAVQPQTIPDVFADRPIEIIGKWTGEPKGRVIVKGKAGNAPYEAAFDVAAEAAKGTDNAALRPLWARERVRMLSDDAAIGEDAETARQITTLGVSYDLLTRHTSFVGVDETPREMLAQAETVNQPLPLPQGVTNNAVGGNQVLAANNGVGSAGTTPEPGAVGLVLLGLAGLLFHRQRGGCR